MTQVLVELLTPKQSSPDFELDLGVFGERYARITACDCMVSIPDNPLGHLHFTAIEVLSYLNTEINPDRLLIHLNTFHRKSDLDTILNQIAEMGIKRLLCVSGDGSPRLPKLAPADLNLDCNTVTSVELIRYITGSYRDRFICGVAFNPYEPIEHEQEKLRRKIEAGAQFIITQPVMDDNAQVQALVDYRLPAWVGVWMSKRIDLFYQCIGREPNAGNMAFDPFAVLKLIRTIYPQFGLYLSMVNFKQDWCGMIREIGGMKVAKKNDR